VAALALALIEALVVNPPAPLLAADTPPLPALVLLALAAGDPLSPLPQLAAQRRGTAQAMAAETMRVGLMDRPE
jgi:hypothetical protein